MEKQLEYTNPYHGTQIVVNADRPDWAKLWAIAHGKNVSECWCYRCFLSKGRKVGNDVPQTRPS